MADVGDDVWMGEALELARTAAAEQEIPVGAVIVRDQKIIGRGYNQPIKSNDPSAHAEMVAIRDACSALANYRIPNTTLYVTIEPCTMCLGAIVHARIDQVVFAAKEPKAGALTSHPEALDADYFNHKIEWYGGVCESEANALMQAFFKQRRQAKAEGPG